MNTDKAWIYYNSPRICPQAPLGYTMKSNYLMSLDDFYPHLVQMPQKIQIIFLVVYSILLIDVIYNSIYKFNLVMGYVPHSSILLCVVIVFCIIVTIYFSFLKK